MICTIRTLRKITLTAIILFILYQLPMCIGGYANSKIFPNMQEPVIMACLSDWMVGFIACLVAVFVLWILTSVVLFIWDIV